MNEDLKTYIVYGLDVAQTIAFIVVVAAFAITLNDLGNKADFLTVRLDEVIAKPTTESYSGTVIRDVQLMNNVFDDQPAFLMTPTDAQVASIGDKPEWAKMKHEVYYPTKKEPMK